MQCMKDTCSAPATIIGRTKDGPKKWTVLTRVCACEAHRGIISTVPPPKDNKIINTPIPPGVNALSIEQLEGLYKRHADEPRFGANALAVDLKMPRTTVIAALRMAGIEL